MPLQRPTCHTCHAQGTGWGLAAVPSNFIMAYLVLAVLSAVTHLRTFSANRTVQVRSG